MRGPGGPVLSLNPAAPSSVYAASRQEQRSSPPGHFRQQTSPVRPDHPGAGSSKKRTPQPRRRVGEDCLVVGAVHCEPFSAEFPVKQGKYREFSGFRATWRASNRRKRRECKGNPAAAPKNLTGNFFRITGNWKPGSGISVRPSSWTGQGWGRPRPPERVHRFPDQFGRRSKVLRY